MAKLMITENNKVITYQQSLLCSTFQVSFSSLNRNAEEVFNHAISVMYPKEKGFDCEQSRIADFGDKVCYQYKMFNLLNINFDKSIIKKNVK